MKDVFLIITVTNTSQNYVRVVMNVIIRVTPSTQQQSYLSAKNIPVWVRHVLVPGITDVDEYLDRLGEFIGTLNNVEQVEVLPYHELGVYKWEALNLKYPLADTEPPTDERVANAYDRPARHL